MKKVMLADPKEFAHHSPSNSKPATLKISLIKKEFEFQQRYPEPLKLNLAFKLLRTSPLTQPLFNYIPTASTSDSG
jgi:hypothetical protein